MHEYTSATYVKDSGHLHKQSKTWNVDHVNCVNRVNHVDHVNSVNHVNQVNHSYVSHVNYALAVHVTAVLVNTCTPSIATIIMN